MDQDKEKTTRLDKFVCPFGGQEIELLQVDYAAGGMPLLRLRIRERTRFTIFEVDAVTAARWGAVLGRWASVHSAPPADDAGATNPE